MNYRIEEQIQSIDQQSLEGYYRFPAEEEVLNLALKLLLKPSVSLLTFLCPPQQTTKAIIPKNGEQSKALNGETWVTDDAPTDPEYGVEEGAKDEDSIKDHRIEVLGEVDGFSADGSILVGLIIIFYFLFLILIDFLFCFFLLRLFFILCCLLFQLLLFGFFGYFFLFIGLGFHTVQHKQNDEQESDDLHVVYQYNMNISMRFQYNQQKNQMQEESTTSQILSILYPEAQYPNLLAPVKEVLHSEASVEQKMKIIKSHTKNDREELKNQLHDQSVRNGIEYLELSFLLMEEQKQNYELRRKLFIQNLTMWSQLLGSQLTTQSKIIGLICDKFYNLDTNREFERKPTNINYCSLITKQSQKYYICYTCGVQFINRSSVIICKGCWVEENHTAHHYDERQSQNRYCQCGRIERGKKEGFCSKHNSQPIEVEIQEKDKFLTYFQFMFTLMANFKYWKGIEKKLQKPVQSLISKLKADLHSLTKDSAYYSRITFELFMMNVKICQADKEMNELIIQQIYENREWEALINNIVSDQQTKYKFVEFITQGEETLIHNFSLKLRNYLLEDFYVLKRLSMQGKFLRERIKQYIGVSILHQEGEKLLQEYVKNQIKVCEGNFNNFDFISRERGNQEYIKYLKEEIQMMLLKQMLSQLNKQKKTYEELQSVKHSHRVFLTLMTKLVGCVLKGSHITSDSYLQQLKGLGFQQQHIILLIRTIFKGLASNMLFTKDRFLEVGFLSLMHVAINHPQKQSFIAKFWESFFKQTGVQRVLEGIYLLICKMSNFYWLHAQTSHLILTQEKEIKENFQRIKQLFCSMLYEQKKHDSSKIWKLKKNGILNFQGAAKLLNSLCKYDEDSSQFVYESQQKYPNPLLRFKIPEATNRLRRHLHALKQIRLSDKYDITNPKERKILDSFFKHQSFYSLFSKFWTNEQNTSDGVQFSIYYVFIVVLIYQLTDGSIAENEMEIKKIKSDQAYRKKLIKSNAKDLSEVLEVQYKVQEKQQQKKEQEKKQEKKEGIICEQCKEVIEDKKEIIYPAKVLFKKSVSSSFHGVEEKAQINIKQCFHSLHLKCFFNTNYEGGSFSCPKCSQSFNFFLPQTICEDNKSLARKCSNILVTSLIINEKYFDYDNMFIVLFKYVLKQKCFQSILVTDRASEKIIQNSTKTKQHIYRLLKQIYDSSPQFSKLDYKKNIEELLQQIKGCSPVFLQLQYLMVELLWSSISKEEIQINHQYLKTIQKSISSRDFQIYLKELQVLTQKPIVIEQKEEIKEGKVKLALNIRQLPKKPTQQFTQAMKGQCKCGSKAIYGLCLLCEQKECQKCYDKKNHTNQRHLGRCLWITLPFGNIVLKKYSNENRWQIYANEFRMGFASRNQMKAAQQFELNERRVEKAIEGYICFD